MDDLSVLINGYAYNGGVNGDTSTQIATRMLADEPKHAWPTIIWAGRNNFTDAPTVESDIASMVASLKSSDYLVLSILNADNEASGSTNYNDIVGINSTLAATYGAHYLDVREYLVSLYNPGDPTDVANHAADEPPASLHNDSVHLNDTGYQDVANYVYAHRAELGLN